MILEELYGLLNDSTKQRFLELLLADTTLKSKKSTDLSVWLIENRLQISVKLRNQLKFIIEVSGDEPIIMEDMEFWKFRAIGTKSMREIYELCKAQNIDIRTSPNYAR